MTTATGSRTFDATHTAVTFPLGGIGTGNVSLGARGELIDWEIFNSPAKGNHLPNTFFTIRLQAPNQPPIQRVLEGPLQPPHNGSHGYHPWQHGGLPRFANSTFCGEYPLATVTLEDPKLPVRVELEAFTPLIPLNPEDSGIPCASLTYTVTNLSDQPLAMTLVGSICNPVGGVLFDPFMNIAPSLHGRTKNAARSEGSLHGIYMDVDGIEPGDLDYGSVSLVTTHANVTVKPHWLRSGWWDYLQEFWDDLSSDGLLTDLGYDTPSPDGRPDTGSLGLVDTLPPGESRRFQFWITWYFPNRRNTWMTQHQIQNAISQRNSTPIGESTRIIRNHYATRFADSWEVAEYAIREWQRLDADTRKFHSAFFDSTLPRYVLDAVSANIVPVRSNTCFWLEDGRFYGWEGCFDDDGSCAGTCTHVWSYAYTVAFMFPSLEREMRRIEFQVETEPDGYMSFRNFKSMGETFDWTWANQKPEAASDGQMGSILRAYREWQLSGDRTWLESIWDGVKRSLEFAGVHWDTDHDFVLDGKQHNTYDIEFYGPNPLSGIYYLAALRATEEMANVLGDTAVAARCHAGFAQGSQKLDALLWNGEYFVQRIEDVDAFKYQHGLGCLSDQLLGQLHAHALGLGDLLPREHVHQAAKSIFDYNFLADFHDHVNCQRTYVLNGEAGLLLCTWPHGGRPKFPFPYSDEVWTGYEYHVAAELIYDGWLEDGLRIIEAVRARHDGISRSPWNEVECGHHYARSMSSWTVLLALSGQHADAGQAALSFNPVADASLDPNRFQCFWSNGRAWGRYIQSRESADGTWSSEIEVLGGTLNGVTVSACGTSRKFPFEA
ncbi:MAG: GH116 family glycosyl-hydrolase [Chloroflexota bacterium]